MRRTLVYALPAVLYAGAIFFASSVPNPPGMPMPSGDKLLHFGVFLGLGFVCARACSGYGFGAPRAAMLGALAGAAYGATDEIHQMLVPNRFPELADVVADALGAVAGAGLWRLTLGRSSSPPPAQEHS